MIAHVILDFVDHGEIRKIDQKDLHFRLGQNTVSRRSCSKQRVLHQIGWVFVFNANTNPHGVDFRRIVEIDYLVAHHLVVRDVEINAVVRTQSRRTPVNLHYFGKALVYL